MSSIGAFKVLLFGQDPFAFLETFGSIRDRFALTVARFDQTNFDESSFDLGEPESSFATLTQAGTLKGSSFAVLAQSGRLIKGSASFATLTIGADLFESGFATLEQRGALLTSSFATLETSGVFAALASFATLESVGHILAGAETAILPVEALIVQRFYSGISDAKLFQASLMRFHPSKFHPLFRRRR